QLRSCSRPRRSSNIPQSGAVRCGLMSLAPPVVELDAVTKRYGTVEAVRGISLRIDAGEVVSSVGPTGAEKPTSGGSWLGRREPPSGTVRLFGLPPTDRRARSRAGVMLQESGTPGVLTVRELIELFRTYYPSPLPSDRAI